MAFRICMEILHCHVFVVFLSLAVAWPDHHIRVSLHGNDTTTCLTNYSIPCKTLDFVFNNSLENSTLINITEGTYNLVNFYNISHKQDILIVGELDKVVIQCVNVSLGNAAGLSWLQSENITFRFLIFDGCGHVIQTSPLFERSDTIYNFLTGLSFVYCQDLNFCNCTFRNSVGQAVTLYDSGGKVDFIGSNFIHNGRTNSYINFNSSLQKNGGGVMIHLTKHGYFNDTIHQRYSNNNNFLFKETNFQQNSYHKLAKSEDAPPPFGWGGGLTIIVCGTATNNRFSIHLCKFGANEAIWGGGLFAQFQDSAGGNSISLSDNIFRSNSASNGGGAVRTGNNIIEQNKTIFVGENGMQLVRNQFYTNRAELGGGLSHFGWTYNQQNDSDYRTIVIKDCIFEGNMATIGSSIAINLNDGNNWRAIGPQVPYSVHLIDCSFEFDGAISRDKTIIGMAAVYSARVPIVLKGNNSFMNNSNTALLLDNAPLKVINQTLFIRNTGYVGGALAFYGQTKLVMTKNSRLFFEHNQALQKGGAIYIRAPGPDIAPFKTVELRRYQCILQYEDADSKIIHVDNIDKWQTKLEFLNNFAPQFYGNSIYATTLQSCYRKEETSTKNTAFEWENVIDFNDGNKEEEISTNPIAIDFNHDDWHRSPYEMFEAQIRFRDEKNTTVSGIAKIELSPRPSSDYVKLEPESSLFVVLANKIGNSTQSVIPGLRIQGKENQNFSLKISTFNGQVVEVSRNMSLRKCRAGYEQSDYPYKCTCMKERNKYHEGIYNCSEDGGFVNLKMGYWGGFVPNGSDTKSEVFVTYPCPENYCYFNPKKNFFVYNESTICRSNRTSHLCGICKKNYTLSLGSEECYLDVACERKGYDIKWTLPVFFLVVPLVVLLLLRLDFDIFTPYLGSWLYFYQILPYVVQQIERFDDGMQVVLELASWRLPSVVHFSCFMKGFDNITKLFINYLFPLYVLFVVIAIVKITRRCGCHWFGRSNLFNAISTIVVFSYTDLTLISFSVIRWVSLGPKLKVLYVQGSVTSIDFQEYAVKYYILVFLAIVVILLFVIALPFTLLFRPFLPKVPFLGNFKQLFNILQHCYQDKWICFSAFYFILRILILLLTSLVLSAPGPFKTSCIDIVLILSLATFLYVKPYKTDDDSNVRWLNFVDAFILTLLCVMSRMSSARNSEASSTTNNGMTTAIKVLSWFPMIYLVILVVCTIRTCIAAARRQHAGYQIIEDVSSTTGGTDETSVTRSSNPVTGESSRTRSSNLHGAGETSVTSSSYSGTGESSLVRHDADT